MKKITTGIKEVIKHAIDKSGYEYEIVAGYKTTNNLGGFETLYFIDLDGNCGTTEKLEIQYQFSILKFSKCECVPDEAHYIGIYKKPQLK